MTAIHEIPPANVQFKTTGRVWNPDKPGSDAVDLALSYNECAPFAYLLYVGHRGQDCVQWIFGRDLVEQAFNQPGQVGEGDVRINTRPGPIPDAVGEFTRITLSPQGCVDSETAFVALPTWVLRTFHSDTKRLIPLGKEGGAATSAIDAFLRDVARRDGG